MLSRPNEAPHKILEIQEVTAPSILKTEAQHGIQYDQPCLLLDIPAEILTGITSHLDPLTLQSLGLVNKRLDEHVKDDGTWCRAFAQQFLGIGFQSELQDSQKRLLLRREAKTWRQEFITRFQLCRKWEWSRNTTIRHFPVHSAISSMHLMSAHSTLLCASTNYGIVSRSLPLTGKILPGYLNPTGPRNGAGIGNPNVEFAPNVTTCLLTSDGSTVKVLWGIRNGEVSISVANKAMDPVRRGVSFQLTKCHIDDGHAGPVIDAAWDTNELAVTGSADGCVKLWDIRTMKCLWTSEQQTRDLIIDPVVKIATAVTSKGLIACCMRSGNIVVFKGFEQLFHPDRRSGRQKCTARVLNIPCLADSTIPRTQLVTSLHIDPNAFPTCPVILVAYDNDACFYKLSLDMRNVGNSSFQTEIFGNDSFGLISCVCPFFAAGIDQRSFVLTGDCLGYISVYDWQAKDPHTKAGIRPYRRFEAHSNGSSVTAIHWNGTTLITGSAQGTTHVFDGLTFEELRKFPSPTPRFRGRAHAPPVDPNDDGRVRQILVNLDQDVLIVNVGSAVLAWKAGPVGKGVSGGVRGRVSLGNDSREKKKNAGGKWLHSAELKQDIAESRHLIEQELKPSRHKHGTNRQHQVSPDLLGLSEQEALEYAIMLSREDSIPESGSSTSNSNTSPPESSSPEILSAALREGGWETDEVPPDGGYRLAEGNHGVVYAISNSSSHEDDAHSAVSLDSSLTPTIDTNNRILFPPISKSVTPTNISGACSSKLNVTGGRLSAWDTPLRDFAAPSPGARSTASITSPLPRQRRTSTVPSQSPSSDDDMDDDLRFAIELSLAEARSCGDRV